MSFWRSTSGFEVDFILADSVAIECKAIGRLDPSDLKGLRALREEALLRRFLCVVPEDQPRVIDGIEVLPLPLFLSQLWAGEIVAGG